MKTSIFHNGASLPACSVVDLQNNISLRTFVAEPPQLLATGMLWVSITKIYVQLTPEWWSLFDRHMVKLGIWIYVYALLHGVHEGLYVLNFLRLCPHNVCHSCKIKKNVYFIRRFILDRLVRTIVDVKPKNINWSLVNFTGNKRSVLLSNWSVQTSPNFSLCISVLWNS